MRRTEKIVSAMEEALAKVTPGYWHFDDNFALTVTSENPSEMYIQHSRGRNGESDMRYIALCSPENIRILLAERRVMLVAHEQEPVAVPAEVIKAILEIVRVRNDLHAFDGDKRGIAECLCEKEEALICLINEHHDDFRGVDGGAL